MKIIVLSDTHLTDRFDQKQYNALVKVISKADQIILNGDFWDSHQVTFSKFLKSKWKILFPLLKSKKSIYVLGNHDKRINKNVRCFSSKCVDEYTFKLKNIKYKTFHGDQFNGNLGDKFTKKKKILEKIFIYLDIFYQRNFKLLTNILNLFPQKLTEKINDRSKEYAIKNCKSKICKTILLCGHTHHPEIDLTNNYINSGYAKAGKIYYIEISDGSPKLKLLEY